MCEDFATYDELSRLLDRTPVIGKVHALLPLSLPVQTKVLLDPQDLLGHLDSPENHLDQRLLILSPATELADRFPMVRSTSHPPITAINQHMAYHLDYARQHLLTNHKVAERIENDVERHQPQVVVLFLIDGLSYADVLSWPCEVSPCFVDGPSVTFLINEGKVDTQVGFPAIVNHPSIYRRLYQLGYRQAFGYTYWERRNNVIADYMFSDIPFVAVSNFDLLLKRLVSTSVQSGTYIQIVREGLDGLAHGKRELDYLEIEAAIKTILRNVERLSVLLRDKGLTGVIYLTADHGILWKQDHPFRVLGGIGDGKPRFTKTAPSPDRIDYVVEIETETMQYYLLRYPHLAYQIRSNDAGVHGGLSYEESIVPFCSFRI